MTVSKRTDGITIFIPNWNHRNYLARSIGSALRAWRMLALEDIGCEVLVVDDHSRDGSQRLLATMAMMDSNNALNVVLSSHNRGLSYTRDFGMAQARYRWVLCLDADNELAAENIASFYHSAKATGAALTYGNLIHRSGTVDQGIFSNDVIHEGILAQNYIDAMAILDSEQILSLGGYSAGASSHADWELVLHLIAEDRTIVFVPMLLGFYHVLELSMIKQTTFDRSQIVRMFAQRKVGLPSGFRSRMYHPLLGYLI